MVSRGVSWRGTPRPRCAQRARGPDGSTECQEQGPCWEQGSNGHALLGQRGRCFCILPLHSLSERVTGTSCCGAAVNGGARPPGPHRQLASPRAMGSLMGEPGSGKEPTCQSRRRERGGCDPWVGKMPWRRAQQPTPGFLPREPHGQRSLAGYDPQGRGVGHD